VPASACAFEFLLSEEVEPSPIVKTGKLLDADGCLLVNSLAQACTLPRAALTRIHRFFRWLENLYRENLSAALAAGALRPGADIDGLAAALVAFDQGLAVASRCERQRTTLVNGALTLLASIRV